MVNIKYILSISNMST